jgi:hypothetical protein
LNSLQNRIFVAIILQKKSKKSLNHANHCPMMTKKQQSIAEQIAVEKQILHLQKMTDYRMRDYTIEE